MFAPSFIPFLQEVLKPNAYPANLDIWSFYTEDNLSRFPPYDCELLSHVDLTLEDITHGCFSQTLLQGLKPLHAKEVASNYLERMLIKYEQLMQQPQKNPPMSAASPPIGWRAHWNTLLDHSVSLAHITPYYHPQLVSI